MASERTLTLLSFLLLILFLHRTGSATLPKAPAEAPAEPEKEAPPKTKPIAETAPAKAPTALPVADSPSEVPLVQAPPHRARAAPTNVSRILEKAGGYSVFIRLLKSTSVSIQLENQLNASNSLTVFAPTNGAFSALKAGTLNGLSAEQKVQLVQYHILPQFVSFPNFQTLSNPVRTQASNTYDYPMNITVEGSWVNVSTGIVNASISVTVYDDGQLAIYKLDKVLLPLGIFAPRPKPLAPAPAPPLKPKRNANSTSSSSTLTESDGPTVAEAHASDALSLAKNRVGVFVVAAAVIVVLG